jgi:hypothetical protein
MMQLKKPGEKTRIRLYRTTIFLRLIDTMNFTILLPGLSYTIETD